MPNPSNDTRRATAQNIEPDAYPILAPQAPAPQALQTRSPYSSPELEQERSLLSYPPLPQHLDEPIGSSWNKKASLNIDRWQDYVNLEFAGGAL